MMTCGYKINVQGFFKMIVTLYMLDHEYSADNSFRLHCASAQIKKPPQGRDFFVGHFSFVKQLAPVFVLSVQ